MQRGKSRDETPAERQARFADFGSRAAQQADLDALLTEAAAIAADSLGVNYVKILEYQPEQKRLLVRAGVGWGEGVVGCATVGADLESPAGFALQTGAPVIANDLDKEERFRIPELLQRHGVKSAVNVIIRSRDEIFGVFEADSRENEDFGDEDIMFLRGYASVLALALTQNKLLRENLELTQTKEMLLRELQHRTKNNYQIIVGLIQQQEKRVTNIEARDNLQKIARRIQAMGSVQAQLYMSERTDAIDLGNYLLGITGQLLSLRDDPHLQVKLETAVTQVEVPPDKAQAVGLIVNEFLTNSLKHAFDGRTGIFILRLDRTDDRVRLDMRDNGPGMPADCPIGLGLELIDILAGQLDGTVTWSGDDGTRLVLEFPLQ